MLDLFPEGFVEDERGDVVWLSAYTDEHEAERVAGVLEGAAVEPVEEGWEDRWRVFHRPVRVGALWVGPPWEDPPADALAVVVDPGRAFGTGAHPTTQLCLEALLDLPRTSLLDVGCGSGVLSIGAARLGFAPVVAVDLDPAAVEATLSNADANGVAVDARLGDALAEPLPEAATLVANIAAGPVAALRPPRSCAVAVTSGYLLSDAPELDGFRRVRRVQRDGWAADVHERR